MTLVTRRDRWRRLTATRAQLDGVLKRQAMVARRAAQRRLQVARSEGAPVSAKSLPVVSSVSSDDVPREG
jgi:hypothetical protein